MFTDNPQISLDNLEKYADSKWSDIARFEDKDVSEGTISFNVGKALVAIGIMGAPIPWGDLEGPCATSILWPDSKDELHKHKYHLIVTVSSDELTVMELAILLTQITAALIAVTAGAIGVFWCNATMIVPRDIFIEFATDILTQGPPIHIWVDFRAGTSETGQSSGFTTGLSTLGLMEIEAVNSPESLPELRGRLTGLAEYLAINGLVIKDGDTVGENENEMIKVVYEESGFGQKGKVLSLNYSKAKPKKSRLKFW